MSTYKVFNYKVATRKTCIRTKAIVFNILNGYVYYITLVKVTRMEAYVITLFLAILIKEINY